MELIWCPPGSFIMGPGRGDNEPAHPVILTKGFYLGKYEVTPEEHNPSKFKGAKLPVERFHGMIIPASPFGKGENYNQLFLGYENVGKL